MFAHTDSYKSQIIMNSSKSNLMFQAQKPFVKYFKHINKGSLSADGFSYKNKIRMQRRVEVKLVNNSQEIYHSNRVLAYVWLVP